MAGLIILLNGEPKDPRRFVEVLKPFGKMAMAASNAYVVQAGTDQINAVAAALREVGNSEYLIAHVDGGVAYDAPAGMADAGKMLA